MSVFLDILHRAAQKPKRTQQPQVEGDSLKTCSYQPPVWLTERLEIIVSISIIFLFLLMVGATMLPADLFRSSTRHVETQDVPETEVMVQDQNIIQGTYRLKGTMEGVGKIHMTLVIPSESSSEVSGYYSYDRYNIDIELHGDILRYDNPPTINVYEIDQVGDRTGRITGSFDGYTFEGSYTNFRSGRSYPVSLTNVD